jgi:hypothetical protein
MSSNNIKCNTTLKAKSSVLCKVYNVADKITGVNIF